MSFQPDFNGTSFWRDRPVVVTGGASFIGSHLTDKLAELGADVTVVDDLSSGAIENIAQGSTRERIRIHQFDVRMLDRLERVLDGADTVFHLAAVHGGRGYIEHHQAACAQNFSIDGAVFSAAVKQHARKIVYASSACIYPVSIQRNDSRIALLSEPMAGPPYDADGLYGYTKLMGELSLKSLHDEQGLDAVSCRYFSVYGPRSLEDHAITAMIARAFVGQDPFVIWGDGNQVRNWTFVDDIVRGTILAAERVDDGSAINLGTSEHNTVAEAAQLICRTLGVQPTFVFDDKMPVGPTNRSADYRLAWESLGWEPTTTLKDGIRVTAEWYARSRDPRRVRRYLDQALRGRDVHVTQLTRS